MIEMKGVTKVFYKGSINEVAALRNVSLSLNAGEFISVVGSNGAGKSTLINVLAGVYSPDGGTIRIEGRDVTNAPDHERAGFVGRVFQNPLEGTSTSLSIEENLVLALLRGQKRGLARGATAERRRLLRQQLEQLGLGLDERLGARVGLLSGGQRQALTLLMATLKVPKILLLDEHTASLDPATAAYIIQLTDRLVRQYRLTTIMITHNMQQALTLGDRTIMMHKGEIVLDVSGEERRGMTVEALVAKFTEVRRETIVDDELLLSGVR